MQLFYEVLQAGQLLFWVQSPSGTIVCVSQIAKPFLKSCQTHALQPLNVIH